MNHHAPELIAIDHDDYEASHVGRTADGRQFFATTPFIPAGSGQDGREFIAVYLFDSKGSLLEARIDDLGPRARLGQDAVQALFERRIGELGPLTFGRIEVRPFEIERFGTTFGLVARAPEGDDEGGWWVEAQPGNFMAFHEPWDSGEYDT
jgi:hypothetical protein